MTVLGGDTLMMKLFFVLSLAFCSLASAAQVTPQIIDNLLTALSNERLEGGEQGLLVAIQDAVPLLFAEPTSIALNSVMAFIDTDACPLFTMLLHYYERWHYNNNTLMEAMAEIPVCGDSFEVSRLGYTVNGILNQWYTCQRTVPTWVIKQAIIDALVHHHGLDPSCAQTIFDGMQTEGIIDTRTDLISDIVAIIKAVDAYRNLVN